MNISRRSRRVRTIAALAALLTSASILSACAESTSEASSRTETASVVFAVSGTRPLTGQPYIAQTLGYFEDENLEVTTLDAVGANANNLVASGQADFALIGPPGALSMSLRGSETSFVYGSVLGGASGSLLLREGIDSPADVQRLGTLGQGSSVYGYATEYVDRLGMDADIIPMQDAATIVSSLASGQIDAAVGGLRDFEAVVADGRATVYIDASDPDDYAEYIGDEFNEALVFAMTNRVEERKDAYTRAIQAFDRASQWILEHSDEEVAAELLKSQAFDTFSLEQLVPWVAYERPFIAPNGGIVTESMWHTSVSHYANWGIEGFDADSPALTYDARVDMSLLEAAQ